MWLLLCFLRWCRLQSWWNQTSVFVWAKRRINYLRCRYSSFKYFHIFISSILNKLWLADWLTVSGAFVVFEERVSSNFWRKWLNWCCWNCRKRRACCWNREGKIVELGSWFIGAWRLMLFRAWLGKTDGFNWKGSPKGGRFKKNCRWAATKAAGGIMNVFPFTKGVRDGFWGGQTIP